MDYEGFLSPLVIEAYGRYMHRHRLQPDGQLRASDNWQKGIPRDAYMKSGWRHFFEWWAHHRGASHLAGQALEDALCALLFNVSGYLHELLKARVSSEKPARISDRLLAPWPVHVEAPSTDHGQAQAQGDGCGE